MSDIRHRVDPLDVPPVKAVRRLSEFSLSGMSIQDIAQLLIRTRIEALEGNGQFEPRYAALLGQIESHEKARQSPQQKVYFIGAGNEVKIGTSAHPHKRLRELQTARSERLVLLTVVPGGNDLERRLHARFARHSVGGEWFCLEGHLARFIERNRPPSSGGGL